jgi:hypothetical protein
MPKEQYSPGPDLVDICRKLSRLNPEFAEPLSPRAKAFLEKNLPRENISARNIELLAQTFRMRMLAVIEQMEESPVWQARLKAVKQVPNHESRVAATEDEFLSSPSSMRKTVQRALTDPTSRLVLVRDRRENLKEDFSSIIIDPADITDTLLHNLGLDRYLPPKGAKSDERIGCHALAIPSIKEILGHLQPIENFSLKISMPGRFRLMRIAGGRYEGYIFGTQTEEDKTHFFKTDLHGAYRRISHIREGYEDEAKELGRVLDTVKTISMQIVTRWNEIKGGEEVEAFKKQLLETVDSLKFVRNKYKKGIKETIEKGLTFKTARKYKQKIGTDKSGNSVVKRPERVIEVDNPGAVSAGFTKIGGYVDQRRKEVRFVMGELQHDQMKLHQVICDHEIPFAKFYEAVEKMHRELTLLHEDEPLAHAKKQKIIGNLLSLKQQCKPAEKPGTGSKIVMQPYLSFGKRVAGHIDETVSELRMENVDREAAASAFLKIYLVAKINYLFHELQNFYDEFVSPPGKPDYVKMFIEAKRIKNTFGGKRIDEKINGHQIDTPEYNKAYGELYHLLNSITSRLLKAIKSLSSGRPSNVPDKMKYEIRERMRKFKFEELLDS